MRPNTDSWQFQAALSRRLLAWSGLSVAAGAAMALLGDAFWRGLGTQCAGWGLVDAIIAGLGLRQTHQKAAQPASHLPEEQAEARRKLARVLWINTGLDVGYVAGGVVLAATKGRKGSKSRFWRGSGLGIVLQGGFLLLFDLLHALLLR
jgi:hypothetical protein